MVFVGSVEVKVTLPGEMGVMNTVIVLISALYFVAPDPVGRKGEQYWYGIYRRGKDV